MENNAFFNEALTDVRLHPIKTIKPIKKKKSTTTLIIHSFKSSLFLEAEMLMLIIL